MPGIFLVTVSGWQTGAGLPGLSQHSHSTILPPAMQAPVLIITRTKLQGRWGSEFWKVGGHRISIVTLAGTHRPPVSYPKSYQRRPWQWTTFAENRWPHDGRDPTVSLPPATAPGSRSGLGESVGTPA